VRGQRHTPAAHYPQERTGTQCTGGWVGLTARLDSCGKSRPTGIRSPDRPDRRQSLYRLRYPAYLLSILSKYYSNLLILLKEIGAATYFTTNKYYKVLKRLNPLQDHKESVENSD
jgi:hypothetical protein